MSVVERILVVKHGALGDWVLATGCFAAIRRHHPSARITLLTTPAFAELGRRCGWFDEVWTDERPSILADPLAWIRLRRRLIEGEFLRVYDLQTSSRTGHYFRMLPRRRRPEWSGIAAGCSHPHRNPQRPFVHTLERLAEQLGIAGIETVPAPNLDWLYDDIDGKAYPLTSGFSICGLPGRWALHGKPIETPKELRPCRMPPRRRPVQHVGEPELEG